MSSSASSGAPIRAARSAEIPALRDLEVRAGVVFAEIGMAWVADDPPPPPAAYREAITAGRAWVCVDPDDRPLGYLLAEVVDATAHVAQLSVDPGAAHRRLGAALLDHLAGWASGSGLAALTLTTFADVPWNAPYYRRLGFRDVAPDDVGPGLAAVRAEERRRGLDGWPRVAMVGPLHPRPVRTGSRPGPCRPRDRDRPAGPGRGPWSGGGP